MSRFPLLTRRTALKIGGGALSLLIAGPAFAQAQGETPDLVLLNLGDLHSAYDRTPQLLQQVREVKRRFPAVPHVLLFSGDLFEGGNVVAARSQGAADWAFLRALQAEMPVILNIGNHESDLFDLREFVRRARGIGLTVITNLYDQRTGLPYARTFTTIQVGERHIPVLGLGTNAMNTYAKDARPNILAPDPVEFFQATYPALAAGSPFSVVLSHIGLVPDRAILQSVKDTTLVVGSHDHLHLRHQVGRSLYLQNGFKGERLNVVTVRLVPEGVNLQSEDFPITETTPADPVLARLIQQQRQRYLQPADLEVVGQVDRAYSVEAAARWAVEALRQATGADIAALNHTSFGAGFKAGNVTRSEYNEFLRFDNKVVQAQIDAQTLEGLLRLANQDQGKPFEERTGDFVYATQLKPEAGKTYTLTTTDFLTSPENQRRFFGRDGIEFRVLPDVTSKGLLERALKP